MGTTLRWLGFAGLLVVLGRAMWQADLGRAMSMVEQAGPWIALCLLPYLLILALDTAGWRQVFVAVRGGIPYSRLLAVRLSCEAVNVGLPGGAVWSETIAPGLLHRHFGMSLRESIAALATKKWLLMLGHAFYIFVGFVFGYSLLESWSPAMLGHGGLPWLVLLSGALPLAAAVFMWSMLCRGAVAHWLHAALAKIPVFGLASAMERRQRQFLDASAVLGQYTSASRAFGLPATLLFLASWLMEAVEAYVILRLLGVEVGFVEVMAFDGVLSVVRSLAFFTPGGLGVQDLGFLFFFDAMGLPGGAAAGAAFVIIKRSKELFWVLVGALLLLIKGPQKESGQYLTGASS